MPYKTREENLQYWRAYSKRKRIAAKNDPALLKKQRAKAVRDASLRRERIRQLIFNFKKKPCIDCGTELPPEVMDLDHMRGEKLFTLGHCSRGTYRTFQEIETELQKCDVRCPNCHRMRHYHLRHELQTGHS